jgi:ABC-2 type transport system ATP-binding protein
VEALTGEGMAVLYTTHYMEEAERLCDRVGIIDAGRLQAEGTRRELVARVGQLDTVTVEATGDTAAAAAAVAALDGVDDASVTADGLVATVAGAGGRLGSLLAAVADAGAQVRAVQVDEADLEAVFLHLTGRALRD